MNRRELLKGMVAAPVVAMIPIRSPVLPDVLPVPLGGTGATSAALARASLDHACHVAANTAFWKTLKPLRLPLLESPILEGCAPTDTASVFRLPSPFLKSLPPFSLRKSPIASLAPSVESLRSAMQ